MSQSFEDVRQNLRRQAAALPALAEFDSALDGDDVEELIQSDSSVRKALLLFSRRAYTTERAGVDTSGFRDLVRALESRDSEETILLSHFASPAFLITIVTSMEGQVVGGIRVARLPQTADSEPWE